MRLPIAALLVVVGWGAARPAAMHTAVPAQASVASSDRYLHTIAPRDTLIALARTLLVDPRGWRVLQRLNRVRNPRRLQPGATLSIPVELLKSVPASAEVLWVPGWWWIVEPLGVLAGFLVAS